MPPPPDSADFSRLLDRWLDDCASAEEAEKLWQLVTEHAECAAEMAAATRFEGLLAETLKARDVEAEARKVLAVTPRTPGAATERLSQTSKPAPGRTPASFRVFALAAAVVVLGVTSALFWPMTPVSTGKTRQAGRPMQIQPPEPLPAASLEKPLSPQPPSLEMKPVAEPGETLISLLDDFWLNDIAIQNLPLSQAMFLLRQKLQETDIRQTLPLARLNISVPAGATARRVTFHAGSIPYLKAVQVVAALAGCEVITGDFDIQLHLIPGIFPQVAEKRTLGDLLLGRVTADGREVSQDAARISALWEDAAALGIQVTEDGLAQASRGQWEALRLLTDARDQISSLSMPAFALYLVPANPSLPTGSLTPDEAQQLQGLLSRQGLKPTTLVLPEIKPPGIVVSQENAPLITATRMGNDTIYSASPSPADAPLMVLRSSGPEASAVGGLVMNAAAVNSTTALQQANFNAAGVSAVILPAQGAMVRGGVLQVTPPATNSTNPP